MTAKDKTPGELMTRTGANDSASGHQSLHPNSGAAQRQRLLKRLQQGPAARVHELRHRLGFNIVLHWVDQATDCGKVHRVALYELRPGEFQYANVKLEAAA